MLSSSFRLILPICLLFLLISQLCHAAIQLPYGVEEGDEVFPVLLAITSQKQTQHLILKLVHFTEGPVVQRNLPAVGQFAFFERRHNSLFISPNGAVSFGTPFGTFSFYSHISRTFSLPCRSKCSRIGSSKEGHRRRFLRAPGLVRGSFPSVRGPIFRKGFFIIILFFKPELQPAETC
jgi:hypothetical protein